jgi:uncharacterized SAM-binding protein YcdF (DUF218 family)
MQVKEQMPRRHLPKARLLKKAFVAAVFLVAVAAYGLSTPLVARLLFDHLQIYPALAPSALANAIAGPPMAIVILSAGRREFADEYGDEFNNLALDGLSLERTRYGAFLARKTGLPILVSGGTPEPSPDSLAKLMAETLQIDYGVAVKWIEDRSDNTAENASLSAGILKRANISRVMLVTHAWHMKRSMDAFAANGMAVTPAPTAFYLPGRGGLGDSLTPALGVLRMSGYALHEIIGSVWYRVRYGY